MQPEQAPRGPGDQVVGAGHGMGLLDFQPDSGAYWASNKDNQPQSN